MTNDVPDLINMIITTLRTSYTSKMW